MSRLSIHSPRVIAFARRNEISDLQAYKALKARDANLAEIERREFEKLKRASTFLGFPISPDWNSY